MSAATTDFFDFFASFALVKIMVYEATGAIGRRWRCGGLGARQMNTDFPSDLRTFAERRSAIRDRSSMQNHVDHYISLRLCAFAWKTPFVERGLGAAGAALWLPNGNH